MMMMMMMMDLTNIVECKSTQILFDFSGLLNWISYSWLCCSVNY